MKTITQTEMLRILEEEDVAWMQKVIHSGKTWLYMKTAIPGQSDTVFRTEVEG